MTRTTLTHEVRLSSLSTLRVEGEPAAITATRLQALDRFQTLGFPTTRTEEWKYTSLTPLTRTDFALATPGARVDGAAKVLSRLCVSEQALAELVFINGVFSEGASRIGELPAGLRVTRFVDALAQKSPALEHFARYADFQTHALTALNTALAQDGAVIEVDNGTSVDGFVHLIFIGDSGVGEGEAVMAHPRNLFVIGRNAQLSIAETYAGNGRYFTNVVSELFAGEGSVVDHTKFETESSDGIHIGTLQIHQERDANVTSRTIAIGGGLVRNDINTALLGEGASCSLEGLYIVDGTEHVDNHTVIDHARPHCTSNELFKGILDGNGRGIFDGTIIVRPDAQKTSSRQVNNNLLLSETAIVDSKPTLEIHADDVKCNHGSTIGQLDEEAMFYLRARGVGEEEARNLLIHAFAADIIDRMKLKPLAECIRRTLFARMPQYLPERRESTR
jgi:Fe-S cluster assembly protein SufD